MSKKQKFVVVPTLKGCININEMRMIFAAKCKDFDLQNNEIQFHRFLNHQSKKKFTKETYQKGKSYVI